MLLQHFVALAEQSCGPVFARRESRQRAIGHVLALPCTLGRRTISRAICTLGRARARDWSADYKLYSRSPWSAEHLFEPVFADYVARYPSGLIGAALDETKLAKTGKRIPHASWQRDPLSPPFHTNLLYGLRVLHAVVVFPHYDEPSTPAPARGIPVRFTETPAVKKPGTKATAAERTAYRQACKTHNLSTAAVTMLRGLRARFDAHGAAARPLVVGMDGSFCNRTVFRAPFERTELIARTRKDARLCYPAPAGGRRKYGNARFTPEAVRQDDRIPYQTTQVHFGGAWRPLRYKECLGVLWQRGAGRRPLRLLVLAPQPYQLSIGTRTYYREPGYLLCTDLTTPTVQLLQVYVDRWQIEVNHREEKSLLRVGDAQVRAAQSVPRHPAFAVACYSLLLLAGLRAFGPGWLPAAFPLPAWRKKTPLRPSALDLVTRLRAELHETCDSHYGLDEFAKNLASYAYT